MCTTRNEVGLAKRWEIFEDPSYNPDLAPSDYALFLSLNKFLAAQNLRSDQQTKDSEAD
jgi:hypothetical protein